MFKQTTLTVTLLASGLFASSGYTLAQQNPTTTTQQNPTTTTQQNPTTTTQPDSTTTTQQNPTTTQQNPTTTTQQNPTTTTQQNPTTTQQDSTTTTQQNPTTTQQNPTTTQTTPQNPANLNAVDRDFMSAALSQRESRLGRDRDVRALASATLPMIRSHLQMAIAMRDNLASR